MKLLEQTIYFDIDDEKRDSNGWNIVSLNDEDSIAIRFPTLLSAQEWCISNNFSFTERPV